MYRKKLRKKDCTFQLHTVHRKKLPKRSCMYQQHTMNRKKIRKKNCMSQQDILRRKTCLNFYIHPLDNSLNVMGVKAHIVNLRRNH